jgi:hypothetical protein
MWTYFLTASCNSAEVSFLTQDMKNEDYSLLGRYAPYTYLFFVYLTTLFLPHTLHRSVDREGSCRSLSGVHLEGVKLLNIINPDSRCHIQDSSWEPPEFRSGTLQLEQIWTACCVVYWYLCFSGTLCLNHQNRRDRPIILKMKAVPYSETLALTSGYNTKRRHIPEESMLYSVYKLAQNICNWANFL